MTDRTVVGEFGELEQQPRHDEEDTANDDKCGEDKQTDIDEQPAGDTSEDGDKPKQTE